MVASIMAIILAVGLTAGLAAGLQRVKPWGYVTLERPVAYYEVKPSLPGGKADRSISNGRILMLDGAPVMGGDMKSTWMSGYYLSTNDGKVIGVKGQFLVDWDYYSADRIKKGWVPKGEKSQSMAGSTYTYHLGYYTTNTPAAWKSHYDAVDKVNQAALDKLTKQLETEIQASNIQFVVWTNTTQEGEFRKTNHQLWQELDYPENQYVHLPKGTKVEVLSSQHKMADDLLDRYVKQFAETATPYYMDPVAERKKAEEAEKKQEEEAKKAQSTNSLI